MSFAIWISPEFQLYIMKDYRRLKADENSRLSLNWNLNREIAKLNYRIHTNAIKDTTKRKLLRISELDEKSDTYTMSAYFIAQLGKNYAGGRNKKITGKELVELAWTVIEDVQYMLGGMVVFLEVENEEKLLSFYRNNRFSQFDTRQTTSSEDEPHELVQLLRLL